MPKKGQLKDMDAWEQGIRDRAKHFAVIAFEPRKGQKPLIALDSLKGAIAYAKETMRQENRYRSASVYAIDDSGHHALCGTVNCFDKEWKEVVPQRH